LTGLPADVTRESISEAIDKASQEGRKVAVFVIDLDHFKCSMIRWTPGWRRDTSGNPERLHQSLRHTGTPRGWDTLGRLGGDEFVM